MGEEDAEETTTAIKRPENDDSPQVAQPLEVSVVFESQVIIQAVDGDDSSCNMENLEGFVPSVSKRARGLDTEEEEGNGGNKTWSQKRAIDHGCPRCHCPTITSKMGKGVDETRE